MGPPDTIPDCCYELLGVLHAHNDPIPYRSLSQELQDVGLLKVCRNRNLIDVVIWYESSRRPGGPLPANTAFVGTPAGWVSIYNKGYSSIAQAIERGIASFDPQTHPHIALTRRGDIEFEERNLESKSASNGAEPSSQDPEFQSGNAKPSPSRYGRPRTTDAEHDKELYEARKSCGTKKYRQGVNLLRGRFPNLTEKGLRRAIDRHRKRVGKQTSE